MGWVDPLGLASYDGKQNLGSPSKKFLIKEAELPTKGKIRYVPPKNWKPSNGLPKKDGKIVDRFGNKWIKGASRTKGEGFEWDVQLSKTGKAKIGHLSRDGSHVNVSLEGKVTHL